MINDESGIANGNGAAGGGGGLAGLVAGIAGGFGGGIATVTIGKQVLAGGERLFAAELGAVFQVGSALAATGGGVAGAGRGARVGGCLDAVFGGRHCVATGGVAKHVAMVYGMVVIGIMYRYVEGQSRGSMEVW